MQEADSHFSREQLRGLSLDLTKEVNFVMQIRSFSKEKKQWSAGDGPGVFNWNAKEYGWSIFIGLYGIVFSSKWFQKSSLVLFDGSRLMGLFWKRNFCLSAK